MSQAICFPSPSALYDRVGWRMEFERMSGERRGAAHSPVRSWVQGTMGVFLSLEAPLAQELSSVSLIPPVPLLCSLSDSPGDTR